MCIKNNDWKKLRAVNEKLDAIKTKEFQGMNTPVSCFVTFESEEGFQRALSIKEKDLKVTFLGEKPIISEAPEPTNVIWEHRQYTSA